MRFETLMTADIETVRAWLIHEDPNGEYENIGLSDARIVVAYFHVEDENPAPYLNEDEMEALMEWLASEGILTLLWQNTMGAGGSYEDCPECGHTDFIEPDAEHLCPICQRGIMTGQFRRLGMV